MTDLELAPEEIVDAAVAIFRESGLDAVSMRSVSSRLGVSPVPLYRRVGSKDDLVRAVAERLLADVAPAPGTSERWEEYAGRWARALRARLITTRDSRLTASPGRTAYVDASRPLVEVLRRDGFDPDAAVRACRLLMWAVVGFASVEGAADPTPHGPRARVTDPADPADVDALFEQQLSYLLTGLRAAA